MLYEVITTDDIDFYQETINPKNHDEYKFNGEWVKLNIVKEEIKA